MCIRDSRITDFKRANRALLIQRGNRGVGVEATARAAGIEFGHGSGGSGLAQHAAHITRGVIQDRGGLGRITP